MPGGLLSRWLWIAGATAGMMILQRRRRILVPGEPGRIHLKDANDDSKPSPDAAVQFCNLSSLWYRLIALPMLDGSRVLPVIYIL